MDNHSPLNPPLSLVLSNNWCSGRPVHDVMLLIQAVFRRPHVPELEMVPWITSLFQNNHRTVLGCGQSMSFFSLL